MSPATGTATFSITTPSGTSTDRTLTLPDNSGTVATSGTSGVDSVPVGRGAGNVSTNTAVGASALAANEAGGTNNTAIGYQALDANTTGDGNTAVGDSALGANTTASNSTAVGLEAGLSNTTGSNMTAVGRWALRANTTGNDNTAVGLNALRLNTTGSSNVAVGQQALDANTTASNNTAVGYQAGYSNTTGERSVFIGKDAGRANTTGGFNTFVGQDAGYSNTTGSYNTFVGAQGSGESVTTGSKNTIIGKYNGNQGGLDIRTANNHIVLSDGDGNPAAQWDGTIWRLGDYAGAANNVYVRLNHTTGSITGASFLAMYYNGSFIGDIAQNGTTAVSYNTTSDYRLKENVQPLSGALARVASLKPCTYTWKSAPDEIGEGFIAHELAEVCPQAVTGQKDAVDADGNAKYQSIDTSFLVATLTAAIQELKAEFDAYKATHP